LGTKDKTSSIRGFRTGFAKTTQMFAKGIDVSTCQLDKMRDEPEN
jgi:hypothetical protein